MLEPWNDALLLPPPVNTSKGIYSDIRGLSYICNNIIKILSKQSPLHKEGAILSRFLYKFDKKFRNDIGYRHLKKLNTSLRRYLAINLFKDIENFTSILPCDEDEPYLPTRQMLEYILVRLMTFSKLMIRISQCSRQAAIFYLDRVKRGESHWMSFMPYALLSRLWSLSTILLQHSGRWYAQLYEFLDKLQLKGVAFLPNGYTLPTDLEKWLDIRNVDNFGRFEWSQKKKVDSITLDDDDVDTFENILGYVSQINDENSEKPNFVPNKLKSKDPIQIATVTKNVDIGEVVSRDSFKSLHDHFPLFHKQIQTKVTVRHTIDNVTNKKSLNDFITKEESLRNEGDSQSLTEHLSFMQWHALKNTLLALTDTLSSNRKIERKFKKIWKEKCLNYIELK